jgi:hypothetical protein
MSAGDGELRIVASQDIGQLGPKDGAPVPFHWRWYYHCPAWLLWALLLLSLIVPKANRHRQAWLILIPLGLVLLVWRLPARLFSLPDGATETLDFFVVSVSMAWTMVWLLGHWLAIRNRSITFLLILAVMLAIGLLSHYCHSESSDGLMSSLIGYCLYVVPLPLAMMLAGYSCRKKYSRPWFCGWLFVWLVAAIIGLMLSYLAILTIMRGFGLPMVAFVVLVVPVSLLYAGILYLVNLPFLILAFKSPFYGERFETIFRVGKDRCGEPTPPDLGDSPFATGQS